MLISLSEIKILKSSEQHFLKNLGTYVQFNLIRTLSLGTTEPDSDISESCYNSLRKNFKTAAGQLSDRLKIFAGQKKNLSDRKNDKKKKKK